MIIAIEEGQQELVSFLSAAGHRPVPLYTYQGPVDAVIYLNEHFRQIVPSMQNFTDANHGILMICARHISHQKILEILERKTYDGQHLF